MELVIEIPREPKRILDLIPDGKENAISRKMLVQKAVHYGLVSEKVKDKDREVRMMIQKAREDNVIICKPDGGYYVPTIDDATELAEYVNQEKGRAIAIHSTIKHADRVLEDMLCGRLKKVERR